VANGKTTVKNAADDDSDSGDAAASHSAQKKRRKLDLEGEGRHKSPAPAPTSAPAPESASDTDGESVTYTVNWIYDVPGTGEEVSGTLTHRGASRLRDACEVVVAEGRLVVCAPVSKLRVR
jgi:hypothetical protein